MDRKERIKNLQIKNSRRLLCEKMRTYIKEIDLDNFLSLDSTTELQGIILNHMQDMDRKNLSEKRTLDKSYIKLFKENLDIFANYYQQKIVFFHREFIDIGAIEINVNSVIENIDYILSISDMHKYGCSVFLVSRDMKFGLCLWRGEYDIKLYKWKSEDVLYKSGQQPGCPGKCNMLHL